MSDLFGNPGKITQQPDGSYCWTCSIDAEYYRSTIKPAKISFLIIAAFIMVFGACLYFRYQDPEILAIIAASDAVFLLIAFFVCWIFERISTDPQESYVMTDTFIKTGSGKTSSYFDFKRARSLTISSKYLELKGQVVSKRVYVPEEDMAFVRNYIITHIPMDAEKRYEP